MSHSITSERWRREADPLTEILQRAFLRGPANDSISRLYASKGDRIAELRTMLAPVVRAAVRIDADNASNRLLARVLCWDPAREHLRVCGDPVAVALISLAEQCERISDLMDAQDRGAPPTEITARKKEILDAETRITRAADQLRAWVSSLSPGRSVVTGQPSTTDHRRSIRRNSPGQRRGPPDPPDGPTRACADAEVSP
jgi:hypothetical protein